MTFEVKIIGNKIGYFEDGILIRKIGIREAKKHLKILKNKVVEKNE